VNASYNPSMFDARRIWIFDDEHTQRAAGVYRRVAAQPNWVVRSAVLAFLAVVLVPIVLLILAAVFAMTVVYLVLAGVNAVMSMFRGGRPENDAGRENVRVIRRSDGWPG